MNLKTLCAVTLLPSIVLAQDESKVQLAPDSFKEIVKPAAEISGARLVGLARFGKLATRTREVPVSGLIPGSWAGGSACLTVLSVDGFYQSTATYLVSQDWSGGLAKLTYPSDKPKKLQEIGAKNIAPLLTKGECGTDRSETATIHWGDKVGSNLYVLLNTSRADETFLFFPDFPQVGDVECVPAEAANRTTFDTLCELPSVLLKEGILGVGTVSFKNGEMGREVEFSVYPGRG